ncbi:MAG: hypothetical protein KDI44_17120 [Thiothrix sp.]|nr:hypothetical protein [Thiothrix sp.]HPQ95096.1 hypothetical protein [Thiolinea sp.]
MGFQLEQERSLYLSGHYPARRSWRHLSHHVSRYPHDLRAHTQRILLAQETELHDQLEGSLLDLLLALGSAGRQLRCQLLDAIQDSLPAHSRQQFTHWMTAEDEQELDTEWFSGSVLARGQPARSLKLVQQQRTRSDERYASVLEEARASLDYGQTELAQQLLEREITEDRHTPEIEQELLGIYRHTRNRDRLEQLTEIMIGKRIDLGPDWLATCTAAANW